MHVRNVCEETREEYEHLLAKLIEQIKAEITAEKERLRQEEKTGKKQRVFGGKTLAEARLFSVYGWLYNQSIPHSAEMSKKEEKPPS